MVIPTSRGKNGERYYLYTLDGDEVVFGCKQGLQNAVKTIWKTGSEHILVMATCIPELIGEDIGSFLSELSGEIGAKTACVFLGHFKCNSYTTGAVKTLEAMADFAPPRKRTKTVNIIGAADPFLTDRLKASGYDIRILDRGTPLDTFALMSDAALSLVVSPFGLGLGRKLSERFEIPCIDLHSRYGVAEIDDAVSRIEQIIGVSLTGVFKEARNKVLASESAASKVLAGKTAVYGSIGFALTPPLAAWLAGFGLEPLLIHVEGLTPCDSDYQRTFQAAGFDPPVCHLANNASDTAALEKLAPDLCVGAIRSAKLNVLPGVPGLDSSFGYARSAKLLEALMSKLAKKEEA
jgi:nitrogenase molybdenum-iron protein alpha/beta subunit